MSSAEIELLQKAALEKLESGNDLDATIDLMRQVAEMSETVHGPCSLETAQSLFSLALLLIRLPDSMTEARDLAYQSFEVRKDIKGRIDVSTAITAEFLASIETVLGNLSAAESLLRLCLENAITIVGPGHVNTAKVQFQLGSLIVQILTQLGVSGEDVRITRLNEARELLTQSLISRHRVFAEDSNEIHQTRNILDHVSSLLGHQSTPVDCSIPAPSQHAMRS